MALNPPNDIVTERDGIGRNLTNYGDAEFATCLPFFCTVDGLL